MSRRRRSDTSDEDGAIRDTSTIANAPTFDALYRPSTPAPVMEVVDTFNQINMSEISDGRLWDPTNRSSPVQVSGLPARPVLRPSRAAFSLDPFRLHDSRNVVVCIRRKQRREVILAKGKGGGRHRRRRRGRFTSWRC